MEQSKNPPSPLMNSELPTLPGTYVLLLYLRKGARIVVGRVGPITFKRGWYAYIGSAFGPGGLAARLGRHLRPQKKLHWHIDYLRAIAEPREIWYSTAPESLEHDWAANLLKGTGTPLIGLGCTDCRCISHLFYFALHPDKKCFEAISGGEHAFV